MYFVSVKYCYDENIDNVYGAGISEAIVDVLTGEAQILRTDILYDGGQSLNADIDIGQGKNNNFFTIILVKKN